MCTKSEPAPPQELVGLDNVLLTPHVAGWSPEAVQASVDRFLANAEGHFAGRGVVSYRIRDYSAARRRSA